MESPKTNKKALRKQERIKIEKLKGMDFYYTSESSTL
jgi:hypothetical protein